LVKFDIDVKLDTPLELPLDFDVELSPESDNCGDAALIVPVVVEFNSPLEVTVKVEFE